jgi:N-methylhydantoinase B
MAGKLYLQSGTVLSGKGRQIIPAGDKLILEMPGGGGLGDPMARPAEWVGDDVLNGMVSKESAQQDYGVVTDATGQVDASATQAERARRQAAE